MKSRFRLVRRGARGGIFYCFDSFSGKRFSLQTPDEDRANQIIAAKNQAEKQPSLNLQIAKAYLAGTDAGVGNRTWEDALSCLMETKHGENKARWERAIKDPAFDVIRKRVIAETTAEHLLSVLKIGTVSTNVFLRRVHNFCVDMNWLPWPVLPKRQWPSVRFAEKRAITWDEHQKILARETNGERRAFYELAWQLGAAQSDLANLHAEDVDSETQTITFYRQKTKWRGGPPTQIRFGCAIETILSQLPSRGALFPRLSRLHEKHRAAEFKRRCTGLGIHGVTLHSYRYAWAERAKIAGYPERYAQLALGHNSKAVHRAYAKQAQVTIPPLEEFERKLRKKVIPLPKRKHPEPAASPESQVETKRVQPSLAVARNAAA